MNFLLVVVGATAVGKTDLAIRLAQHIGTDIISADARQFYKEMSIGTAKPTAEELGLVKHHFIDSHSIEDQYNAGLFEKEVLGLLETLFREKKMVVLVGGSGMYVKAVCEGLDTMPTVLPETRNILQQEFDEYGLTHLLAELESKDPDYYQTVDRANPQRILRALEVIRSTQQPYSSFRKGEQALNPNPRNFCTIKIGLARPREELYARIDSRVDKMIAEGLLDEVRNLTPFKNLNALQTVGYKEIFDFLDGTQDWQETLRLLKRNTRHYAKRQLTWFGKDSEIAWFAPHQFEDIIEYVKNKLEKNQKN
ncbi:MAG: tRNA (adenosine(37)-N6)-dimethylallyltransferase MiaA [Cytophagales bacterium]|nr:MAG: tRNA (adenosine(37)-N6)-dimethylallyltransferase MiaA [Cytophagales bacterium]